MAEFEIRSGELVHTLEAPNWMSALGEGLGLFGMSEEDLARVVCDIDAQGDILVRDPRSGRALHIVEKRSSAAGAQIRLAPSTAAAPTEPSVHLAQAETVVDVDAEAAAEVDAPDPRASAAFETLEERAGPAMERLYAASKVVLEADDAAHAGELALDVAMRTVPAESGAVLLLSPDRQTMVFVAARGPRSEGVLGTAIPADKGVAGLACRTRTSLLIREVGRDPRHYKDVDERSGYATQALLAVPLRGSRGVLGVLELLNPFGVAEFEEWHLDAAQIVASRLANRLG